MRVWGLVVLAFVEKLQRGTETVEEAIAITGLMTDRGAFGGMTDSGANSLGRGRWLLVVILIGCGGRLLSLRCGRGDLDWVQDAGFVDKGDGSAFDLLALNLARWSNLCPKCEGLRLGTWFVELHNKGN